jgi:hypothetical protein
MKCMISEYISIIIAFCLVSIIVHNICFLRLQYQLLNENTASSSDTNELESDRATLLLGLS